MALLQCVIAGGAMGQIPTSTPQSSLVADTLEIRGLEVDGIDDENMKRVVVQASGLLIGQEIVLPGDPALALAMRSVFRLGRFSDIEILEDRRDDGGVWLMIRVAPQPSLEGYSIEGVSRKQMRELEGNLFLFPGMPVGPGDVERARMILLNHFYDQGYRSVRVGLTRDTLSHGTIALRFSVDPGPRVKVDEIRIEGNRFMSARTLRRQMKETKEGRWWRFWNRGTYNPAGLRNDLDRIVAYYNDRGYLDARIVRDTAFVAAEDTPDMVVAFHVVEGPRYVIRRVSWSGNTVLSGEALSRALDFERGDVFNQSRLEENLYGNRSGDDVAGLYLDRGYLQVNLQPRVVPVAGDSLDLHVDVNEGRVHTFGRIAIAGNEATREDIIRRALYTVPGDTFSRAAIHASIRQLLELGYFKREALAQGPGLDIDDQDRSVDLTYAIEESNTERFDVAGGFTSAGLFLRLGVTFLNYSLRNTLRPSTWHPVPAGDGQQLGLSVTTNGGLFQRFSLRFAEPWFLGRPGPAGLNVSHTRIHDRFDDPVEEGEEEVQFLATSAGMYHSRPVPRLDERVQLSGGVEYRRFSNSGWTRSLDSGLNQELVFTAGALRNSLDHPLFPRSGSLVEVSVDLAAPFDRFSDGSSWMSYHKWRFRTGWNVPMGRRAAVGWTADFGYVGSIGEEGERFQRFVLGGSPFDTQGVTDFFERDVVHLRGYPIGAVGPRDGAHILGGRIFNAYAAELRWSLVQRPQLSVVPYLFAEAANAWESWATYQPSELFRATGVGLRLVLPLIGPMEFVYGYNLDRFGAVGDHDGSRRWLFQFFFGSEVGLFSR